MDNMAILGCGNMATAITQHFTNDDIALNLYTYTPSQTKAKVLANAIQAQHITDLSDLPPCKYYLIGCKPQQFKALAESLMPQLQGDAIIISLMAGVNSSSIIQLLNTPNVVRLMPNLAAAIQLSVNLFYFSQSISQKEKSAISDIFKTSGKNIIVKHEKEIDIIAPYSSSGPAILFEIARILTDDLHAQGIDYQVAENIISQTLLGTSTLIEKSDQTTTTLRNQVTSKGGMTAEALNLLKQDQLESMLNKAMRQAFIQSQKLNQQIA